MIHSSYDEERCRWIVQHGDNPEAVLFIPYLEIVKSEKGEIEELFCEWIERVHAYENGTLQPHLEPAVSA